MIKLKYLNTKSKRKSIIFSACFVFMGLLLSSCKKDAQLLGSELLSPEDLLASGAVDTFSLFTSSVLNDTSNTDNQPTVILGQIGDPKFGKSDASFYTQFTYEGTFGVAAGTAVTVDSVVLSLHYQGYYGNLTEQSFGVYQLTEDLDIDADYKQNDTKTTSSTNLVVPSSQNQIPAPTTKVVIGDNDTVAPQLRLRLDNAFGVGILNEAINGTAFDTEEAFKTYFKGLYVKTTHNVLNGEGAALFFNLNNNNSQITIHYHLDSDPSDEEILRLKITSTCADFTHVDVDNSGFDIENVLNTPNAGMDQFYAQNFKARAYVQFPGINNIPKNAVIHQALLELPVAYQSGNVYAPPSLLNIGLKTDEGKIVTFNIVQYDNNRKSYVVDLRSYLQEVLRGDLTNTGLYFTSSSSVSRLERLILNGPNSEYKNKPRLIVKFTEF